MGEQTEQIHFVTGKLAADSLTKEVQRLATVVGFEFTIDVLPITVAALMTPTWIAKHINVPKGTTRILLPGYCRGDLSPIKELPTVGEIAIENGPKDLRALVEHFGTESAPNPDYGKYDIEILAEINHAPRLQQSDILAVADRMRDDGANLIDVGCDPGETWDGVAECVSALREAGHRVSIDSMNPEEVAAAIEAGAELVLSVNSQNREQTIAWSKLGDFSVVVVPDDPKSLAGFDETIAWLKEHGIRYRLDPILEPIGFGFAQSLGRYLDVRRRYPDAEIMMGIGNLTELTDCDSAGINALLVGFCQELGIGSILTTEVINWARTSVRECDAARQLMPHAVTQSVLPKRADSRLVMLRDDRLHEQGAETLDALAKSIKDKNFRLFAEQGEIHAITNGLHASNPDPFLLFEQLMNERGKSIDESHAFYLGYEMAKAVTALTLHKQYRQDEALDWGLLTVEEESHRLRRTTAARRGASDPRPASGPRPNTDGEAS